MTLGNADYARFVATRTSPPPQVLYKYVSAATAKLILGNRKLRFQSPLQYNDPFDSQWDALWELRSASAHNRVAALIRTALTDRNSWPSDADQEARSMLESTLRDLDSVPPKERDTKVELLSQQIAAALLAADRTEDPVHRLRERFRILCLTEVDDSVLMWSHYADQHKGVVLGFNTRTLEDTYKRPLSRVRYETDFPRLIDIDKWLHSVVFGPSYEWKDPDVARTLVLLKHADWAYEREWRWVWIAPTTTTSLFDDFTIPSTALVSLGFGCRTCKPTQIALSYLAMASSPFVELFSMTPARDRIALVKMPYSASVNSAPTPSPRSGPSVH